MIRKPTIGILPFKNLSGNKELDPLLEGLVLDIHTDLSRFRDLAVISSYSTELLKAKSQEEAGKLLPADFMVYCTFSGRGEKIRFQLQLVKQNGTIVFAGRHEERFEDLYTKADELTQQLVNVIQQQIHIHLKYESVSKKPEDLRAYDCYQRGMSEIRKGTRTNDQNAREYFNQALEIAPDYAQAYSGLALTYFNEWSCLFWDDWFTNMHKAKEFAIKALQVDENNYRALMVLSRIYLFNRDFDKSEQLLEKALRLNPNDADLLAQGATTFVFLGNMERATVLYQKAIFLNPLHESWYYTYGVFLYFELGEYETCIELAAKMDETSLWIDIEAIIGAAYYQLGDLENAYKHWNQFLEDYHKKIAANSTLADVVKWLRDANPYRTDTLYHAFLDYLLIEEGKEAVHVSPDVQQASLTRSGELWKIKFLNTTIEIPHTKGMLDIARLVEKPECKISSVDLIGTTVKETAVEVIDEKAKRAYKQRLLDLEADIREAEALSHYGRMERLREEFEEITDHLTKSLGLSGRTRKKHSTDEKARTAVTWRIRSSIKKISQIHPPLGKHLQASVKTGSFCEYTPERPTYWKVSY